MTATGIGANYNGSFVACDPVFHTNPDPVPSTIQGTSTSGAYLKDQGVSFTSVDSNGKCVQPATQPFSVTQCIVVACQTTTGGCDPNIDPSCSPELPTQGPSPIIIDVTGNGFALTNAANGVLFDITGTGHPIQMGWTAPGATNAFLALPGPDGLVHSGKQLFGNFTPQPASATPNGFAALAVYDQPANGGNGDGVIDARDAVFASLRLWIDANHDGIAQPNEMYTLPALGVNSITLKYQLDQRADQYGNVAPKSIRAVAHRQAGWRMTSSLSTAIQ